MQLPNNTVPVAIGAAIGIISITVISFANGWVVSAQKMETEMQQANITTQATICAARAEMYLKETNSTEDLQGYQSGAREKRTELAAAHVTTLADDDASTTTVINACAGMLNKARG